MHELISIKDILSFVKSFYNIMKQYDVTGALGEYYWPSVNYLMTGIMYSDV